jgi:mono/diheme cytochrome c family protein
MRFLVTMAWAVGVASVTALAWGAQPSLVLQIGSESRQYTAATLLARPDIVSISVPYDVSYRRSATYRAVPLLALIGAADEGSKQAGPGWASSPRASSQGASPQRVSPGWASPGWASRFDTLEASAADGFIAQIPLALIARGTHGGAVAWLAIEDPAHPWEPLPHHTKSAGPFYLVWENPERSNIRSEQWPHWLMRLTLVESPLHRWPQLELPPGQTSDPSAARSGQKVFLTFCLPCHRLNGGGASDTGPDLGQPMNATRYLTEAGLRAIIRNPRSVRTWPNQTMQGFGVKTLPDADVDNLLVYLRVMAAKPATTGGQ